MKATKMYFVWLEKGDPPFRFEYTNVSEQYLVAEIFTKLYFRMN